MRIFSSFFSAYNPTFSDVVLPKWYPAEWRVGLLDKRLQGIVFRTIPFTCHVLKMDQEKHNFTHLLPCGFKKFDRIFPLVEIVSVIPLVIPAIIFNK
jgi:hypothetical protein